MTIPRIVFNVITVLLCVLVLSGCDNSEKEKALAQAAEAKASLLKIKTELIRTKAERDSIRDRLNETIEARDELAQQLKELNEDYDEVITETDTADEELGKSREAIQILMSQMLEQTKKLNQLENQNSGLKATIEQLQTELAQLSITQTQQQPSEEEQILETKERITETETPETVEP